MLTKLIVLINIYIYQIIMFDALNLYSFVCQLYLNEARKT